MKTFKQFVTEETVDQDQKLELYLQYRKKVIDIKKIYTETTPIKINTGKKTYTFYRNIPYISFKLSGNNDPILKQVLSTTTFSNLKLLELVNHNIVFTDIFIVPVLNRSPAKSFLIVGNVNGRNIVFDRHETAAAGAGQTKIYTSTGPISFFAVLSGLILEVSAVKHLKSILTKYAPALPLEIVVKIIKNALLKIDYLSDSWLSSLVSNFRLKLVNNENYVFNNFIIDIVKFCARNDLDTISTLNLIITDINNDIISTVKSSISNQGYSDTENIDII